METDGLTRILEDFQDEGILGGEEIRFEGTAEEFSEYIIEQLEEFGYKIYNIANIQAYVEAAEELIK